MSASQQPLKVGAVNYLNSKPLIRGFDEVAPAARLTCDLPSRLADALGSGRLDVALIPVYEYFRGEAYQIVSDACVASRGPVLSVKTYFFRHPHEIRTLALDEGSRTSAALSRVLLWKRFGLRPECLPLPIGSSLDGAEADAVLLIGDRAMLPLQSHRTPVAEWDLGEEWLRETGLPFVFACWVARRGVDPEGIGPLLARCRDLGLQSLPEIASTEAPKLGVQEHDAQRYLEENLRYTLDREALLGLETFRSLCIEATLLDTPCVSGSKT